MKREFLDKRVNDGIGRITGNEWIMITATRPVCQALGPGVGN